MFDYAQRLQLALTDVARRSALKGVAGLVVAIGAGFLLAALWSFLAHSLGWGGTVASLVIGGVFVAVGLIILVISDRRRHQMPTTDDLKREVEARINLAADAAVDRARAEAFRVVDMAGNKAHSLMDDATYRATKFADDAERRVYGFARNAAQTVGLNAQNVATAKKGARDAADGARRAADSNAGSMAKLVSAFALGVTLAAKLHEARRRPRDQHDDDDTL